MIKEFSAGGVIYKKEGNEIYIAMIRDSFGKWTFPKGRIEKDEKPENAALRESEEEMGLKNLKLIFKIGEIIFWFKDKWEKKGETVNKTVYYYLIEAEKPFSFTPLKKEIQEAKWIPINKIENISSYKDNTKIIEKVISYFK